MSGRFRSGAEKSFLSLAQVAREADRLNSLRREFAEEVGLI